MSNEKTKQIAKLNDLLRTTFNPMVGQIMITQGISSLPEEDRSSIFNLIRTFNNFTIDNDPYGEHDFGKIEHNGNKVFFKIDYYAPDIQHLSEDPSNPAITKRVMTIMLANEY